MGKEVIIDNAEYEIILEGCISQIQHARRAVAKQLNGSLMGIYWYIGSVLTEKQLSEGYGSGTVGRLSSDLKTEFPDMGLSPRNLWDMKRFYERYKDADAKLRQAVAVFHRGHEDDNKFVDIAIASNADYIITNDKHFKILSKISFTKV
jgi:DUF1016 N-terminal domain